MPSLHTFRSLTWIIQDGVSSGMSLGPSTLHGQIQMDPVFCTVKFKCPQCGANFVVKYPREGTAKVFKYCTFAPTPPPPLRLNIEMCITDFTSGKFTEVKFRGKMTGHNKKCSKQKPLMFDGSFGFPRKT